MKLGREKRKQPLNRSITVGCVAFIIVLCVLLSMANLTIYRNYVYDDYRSYIANILDYAMSCIDADDLKRCVETGVESPKYKETLLRMDQMMEHFSDIHYFYVVRPLNTEDTGSVMSVLSAERYYDRYIDTEGNLYLGWISDDEYDAETAAQLFDVMNGDGIVYFQERTEWGTDYTGAVSVKDSAGEGFAVLAVDIDISFLNAMIRQYALVNIGIILTAGLVFIGLFLLWSRKNITRPIKALEESAVGFAVRSHGQRDLEALSFRAPEMTVNNEIKSLCDAVVKMAVDMRNYVSEIISAEKKAERMRELANRDALTGIRNKTAYDFEVRRVKARMVAGETRFGLAVIDLNSLKKINDTCGHDKGDLAIQKLSALVCRVFQHSPVFRIGGDEFAAILYGDDFDRAEELERAFIAEIEKASADTSLPLWERISAAIGMAFFDESADSGWDSVFRRADQVMYERKKEMKAGHVR